MLFCWYWCKTSPFVLWTRVLQGAAVLVFCLPFQRVFVYKHPGHFQLGMYHVIQVFFYFRFKSRLSFCRMTFPFLWLQISRETSATMKRPWWSCQTISMNWTDEWTSTCGTSKPNTMTTAPANRGPGRGKTATARSSLPSFLSCFLCAGKILVYSFWNVQLFVNWMYGHCTVLS